ncbi:MAG: type I secretion protein TolC, partial [Alphaproteobacteria bacterium]
MLRRNLLAFLVCYAMAPCANTSADSLKNALAKAYLSNPILQAARAKLRAKDEEVAEAVSGWRPKVTFKY